MYLADEVRANQGSIHPLVGLLGLSFVDSGELHYQFAVNAHLPRGEYYLIQLYEWIIGEPSNQQLVPVQWFIDNHVKFYTNETDWRAAAEDAQRKSEYIRREREREQGKG